jgi:hypothetical protein
MHTEDTGPAAGNTSPNEGVVEAARAIRPYLEELVDPQAAAGLDRQLADTLLGPADTAAERIRRLRDLVDTHPATRRFLTEVLTDPPHFRPPYQQPHYGPIGAAVSVAVSVGCGVDPEIGVAIDWVGFEVVRAPPNSVVSCWMARPESARRSAASVPRP